MPSEFYFIGHKLALSSFIRPVINVSAKYSRAWSLFFLVGTFEHLRQGGD